MKRDKAPKLTEIAARIDAHLKRFEADPKVNVKPEGKYRLNPYFNARAVDSGRYVYVMYASFQGDTPLTKPQALAYLAWLDAGGVGKHYGHTGESR